MNMNRMLTAELDVLKEAKLEAQIESGRLQESLQHVC